MHDNAPEKQILVVDDNRDAVTIMQRLLQLKGYTVHTATNGQAGLEAAGQLRPAVMVLDLAMPEMDGFTLCRLIRAEPWGAAVLMIALSGYSSDADRQRSREAGFDRHLSKPVDFTTLLALLTERLG